MGMHSCAIAVHFHPHGFALPLLVPFLKSARRNKLSAYQNSRVIDMHLADEVRLGCVAGPFDAPPVQDLHVSSFGVIPYRGPILSARPQRQRWNRSRILASPVHQNG